MSDSRREVTALSPPHPQQALSPLQGSRGGTSASRLDGLEQRLLQRLRGRAFPPGSILIVGFSAGSDSLALAAALGRVAPLAAVTLVLAHVDHRLRPASDIEQERAAQLASVLGLPFRCLTLETYPSHIHPGVGIEEAARRERYLALGTLCRQTGAAALVLAHHRDDQAETVLLHLLRGSGLAGARGMAEWAERRVPWWSTTPEAMSLGTWRPLLTESHDLLAAYGHDRALVPVQDPSNDNPQFRRNALRHDVLPIMEEIMPGARAALARHGQLVADDDEALDGWAARVLDSALCRDGSLEPAALDGPPAAIGRRVIRQWLSLASGGMISAPAERVEALLARARDGNGRIELGGGWTAVTTRHHYRLVRSTEG